MSPFILSILIGRTVLAPGWYSRRSLTLIHCHLLDLMCSPQFIAQSYHDRLHWVPTASLSWTHSLKLSGLRVLLVTFAKSDISLLKAPKPCVSYIFHLKEILISSHSPFHFKSWDAYLLNSCWLLRSTSLTYLTEHWVVFLNSAWIRLFSISV